MSDIAGFGFVDDGSEVELGEGFANPVTEMGVVGMGRGR